MRVALTLEAAKVSPRASNGCADSSWDQPEYPIKVSRLIGDSSRTIIDYFKDPAAHLLLEVIPNGLSAPACLPATQRSTFATRGLVALPVQGRLIPIWVAMQAVRQHSRVVRFGAASDILDFFRLSKDGKRYRRLIEGFQ